MFPIPPDVSGLVFDCDGTLADTMPLHLQTWRRAMRELGGDITPEEFFEFAGVPTYAIIRELNRRHGWSIDPIRGGDLKESYYVDVVHGALPIAEVVAVVEAHRGKLPMAVATGGQRMVVSRTLETIRLLDAFDAIVTADDVEHGKPAPDIFLESARRIGVAPAACLVFEDADAGVEAARRAGMRCVDVRRYALAAHASRAV